jgi:hypothetical protein
MEISIESGNFNRKWKFQDSKFREFKIRHFAFSRFESRHLTNNFKLLDFFFYD